MLTEAIRKVAGGETLLFWEEEGRREKHLGELMKEGCKLEQLLLYI